MILLALDSSSKACSAAVFADGVLLSEQYLNTGLTHSTTLMPTIDNALKLADVSVSDLSLIAITDGPGSFTGLRIGMGTAKGIAFGTGIDIMPVSTLLSLAFNVAGDGYIATLLDARAGQLYSALFRRQGGVLERVWEDAPRTLTDIADKLPEQCLLVGDGAHIVHEACGRTLSPQNVRFQRASSVGAAAIWLMEQGEKPKDCGEVVPTYLRPEPEVKIKL